MIMKLATPCLVLAALMAPVGGQVCAQGALVLDDKIQLGEVRGRIDHMAIDLGRRRLFVAELENDSVAVVDLEARKVAHVISNARTPQGLGYLPANDTLYVANGGDGALRIFAGNDYRYLETIPLGDDADNVRVDNAAKQVLVSYGDGAIAVIDATTRKKISDIALASHPESFQLDRRMNRLFINEPKRQVITVVERDTDQVTAEWKIRNNSNFPMTLNEASGHVLVVYRNPAQIAVFAASNGSTETSLETCGDADDMFTDAKRSRVYVSCGEGFVDVFDTRDGKYQRVGHLLTVPGARTSLFVPELDRLFLAVRATAQEPAAIWVFRPMP